MGTPFRCLVPYHLFSLSVPEEEFERSPAETLRAIDAALSGPRRATMLQLIGHFRRDLLWRLPGSRVAENLLLEAVHGQRAAKDGRQRKCCLLEPVLTRGGWRRGGASQERGGRSST